MKRLNVCVFVAIVSLTLATNGDTLTWKGGASGLFSQAENWTTDGTHTTPQAGDTVKFASATTLSAETVTLGAGDLTFLCAAKVTSNVSFAGPMTFVKDDWAELVMNGQSSYTGGTRILHGDICCNCAQAVGTGTVTVDRTDYRAYVYFNGKYTFANDIVCKGGTDVCVQSYGSHISFNESATLTGKITSEDCDAWIFNMWGSDKIAYLANIIEVSDHILHLVSNGNSGGFKLSGACEAESVERVCLSDGTHQLVVAGDLGGVAGALSMNSGSAIFENAGVFGGTDVVLDGTFTKLTLSRNTNLRDDVNIALKSGMMICLNGDVRVGSLSVGGENLPAGRYTVATLPTVLEGSGMLCVNVSLPAAVWTGGASGRFLDPANWDTGSVPTNGATAYFTSATTVTGDAVGIDIGPEGMTLVLDADVTFASRIAGSGRLTKQGAGALKMNEIAAHTGGTRILEGTYWLNKAGTWNNGKLILDRSSKSVSLRAEYCTVANDIEILGPFRSENTFYLNGDANFTGTISCQDGNFSMYNVWTANADLMSPISANIEAPGRQLYLWSNGQSLKSGYRFTGIVNCSPVKCGKSPVQFAKFDVAQEETYLSQGGTNTFASTATWAGTNLVVKGQEALSVLHLTSSTNLCDDITLSLSADTYGAKLLLDGGVKQKIAKFLIDGVDMGAGTFSSANCSAILGMGKLRVGPPPGLMLIFR